MMSFLGYLSGFTAGASAALLASVWQGFLLAGCVALCLRMAPRLSPAIRCVVWLAVFVVIGALDLVWLTGSSASGLARPGGMHLDARWGLGLAGVWAALTVVRLAGLIAAAVHLAGVARRATPLDGAAGTAAGRNEPMICFSAEVDRPGVVGFFHPRILLPVGLREQLSAEEMEAILLHEREHLRRGDDWTNLLQKIGLALMPLNPALAWVERRLCRERELACDDRVLRQTRARKVYAACLARLAEDAMLRRPLALALGLAGRGSELGRRVVRILAQPEAVLGRRAAAGVSGVLIAGLLGGGFELARCPQVVTFSPGSEASFAYSLPAATRTAADRRGSLKFGAPPRLVRAVAVMDAPVRRSITSERRRVISRKARLKKARREAQSGREGWIVLTRWEEAGDGALVPVRFVVPANSSVSSYASVPVGSGWLVFQL